MSPTFSLIELNNPERLFVIPEINSSLSHSVMDSFIASIEFHSSPERAGRALHVNFHVNLPPFPAELSREDRREAESG